MMKCKESRVRVSVIALSKPNIEEWPKLNLLKTGINDWRAMYLMHII